MHIFIIIPVGTPADSSTSKTSTEWWAVSDRPDSVMILGCGKSFCWRHPPCSTLHHSHIPECCSSHCFRYWQSAYRRNQHQAHLQHLQNQDYNPIYIFARKTGQLRAKQFLSCEFYSPGCQCGNAPDAGFLSYCWFRGNRALIIHLK